MSDSQLLINVPLLLLLGAAALVDLQVRKIPNVLTFGGAVFAIVLNGTVNGASGVVLAALGWLLCLLCYLPFYVRGGMAAGDVKLMASVGAFVGPVVGVFACFTSLIAGGIVAILSLACFPRMLAHEKSDAKAPSGLDESLKARIPYAGSIAAGTSFVLLVPSVIPPALMQIGV